MNELFIIFHFLFTPFYEIKQQLLICCLNKRKKHRISRLQMFYKTRVKNFANSQKNTYVRASLLIKVFKKRLGQKCFPVNFVKFSELLIFYRTPLPFLKTVNLCLDSLYSISSFHFCIVVFTYLSSNIQNRSNVLLQRIVLDFQ